jgi:hypothetical protein
VTIRSRPRPRARRTSSSSSRSSLKMSCWNSYDVISCAHRDSGTLVGYKRQREFHGGLLIAGHWIQRASAVVRWDEGVVRGVTRVELGTFLSRIAMSHVQESTIF